MAAGAAGEMRVWDDEYVVYNPHSGATHMLGPAAGQILLLLQQRAMGAAALARALDAEELGSAGGADFLKEVEELLASLSALALIEGD